MKLVRLTSLALALAVPAACGPPPESGPGAADADRPLVVATIFPVGDLAQLLGGDAIRVEVILPPGASPATFEVTPADLRRIGAARAFLAIGGGLDGWIGDLSAQAPDATVWTLTEGIELRHGGEGHAEGNPHVWLDPVLVRDVFLPRLEAAAIAAAPDAEEAIRERARAVSDSLSALDGELRRELDALETRAFVATHPAWTYFAERYGLREIGSIHETPGEDPSSRALAELIERSREAGVRAVFAEPQVGEVAARSLASELGVPIVVLDPLGGPGMDGRDGYFALMRYNTHQFLRAMGPRQ
jgi:zinc transport system substrate-binding protein